MALMKKTQRTFAGGMIDKDLTGRQDLNKYAQGCLTLENFKVRKQGNIIKRSGTDLVCDFSSCLGNLASDAISTAKLVPLIQERESGFYMLLTGNRAFLISPTGMKMANGTWSKNPSWSASATWSADALPEGHAFDTQPSFSNGTWTWTDTGSQAWTSSGAAKDVKLTFKATINNTEVTFDATFGNDATHTAPYSIAIPFNDGDLSMIDWCQSGDTVFFAHRTYPPCKIVYSGGWLEYTKLQFRQGIGTPPSISSVEKLGDKWTGSGGLVHLEYAVTAVKDGVETGLSVPFATEYNAPWDESSSIRINIDTTGLEPDSWDCFYIYKKQSDVFGLIGTTSNQTAFVSISSGFAVDGTLYPTGFSTFDKNVHLRESGNKFGSVSKIQDYEHTIIEVHIVGSNNVDSIPHETSYGLNAWKAQVNATGGDHTTAGAATYSNTPQKASTGTNVSFTLNSAGVVMSQFTMRIGSLLHAVKHTHTVDCLDKWLYRVISFDSWYCVKATQPIRTVYREENFWEADYSEFAACPAKFFKAQYEYYDNGNWVTSAQYDCSAVVDQSNPGTGWTAVAGSSNRFRKTYTSSDYITSYTDAATVLTRMEYNQPAVGSTVSFAIPAAIKGKKIRRITVFGFAGNEAGAAAASLIVNGIACYQEGTYVDSFTDENITPDLTITPPKTDDHFVNPGEYPGCVQIYSQRLVYAASAEDPFKFWMSCTGDLYNFDVHEYVRASDAISASTAALEMPRINRMLVHRDLMLFADGGEWQVSTSTGTAVSPSTIAAKLQSTVGCASWLKPVPVDADIIFCDSSGETLMSTRYNFASDGYESSNLSVLSQRLFRNNRIQAMAYAQFPESTIECVLADGTIASLVYMKEHEVCAWSKQVLGGGWRAFDVAANKSVIYGSSNCLFLATRKYDVTNNNSSSSVREWAVLSLRDIDPNDVSVFGSLRMDAVRTVTVPRTGSDIVPVGTDPEPTITPPTPGYEETVIKVGETRQTTEGVKYITGDIYAIGCAFKSVLKTTSPEFTDKETAQMEIKNATESEIRVIDGSDFTVRQPDVPASKATVMKVPCSIDTSSDSFTLAPGDADCRLPLVGNNSTNGSIVLEHTGVLPLSVLSVTSSFRIEFSNHANGGSNNGND